MSRNTNADARALDRRLPDRLVTALRRYRRGGRRSRTVRRIVAVALCVAAAVVASLSPRTPSPGTAVLAAAHDIATGVTLQASDLQTVSALSPPKGAISASRTALGQVTSGPMRAGEIFTDARILGTDGPQPGPGRSAVAVRLANPAVADMLHPGMHVTVIAISDSPGQTSAHAQRLTDDAVVLSLPKADSGSLAGPARSATAILAVPEFTADAVAAASASNDIALRFG